LAWGKRVVISNRGNFYLLVVVVVVVLVVVGAWTDLAENSDTWRALVNVVMYLRVS